MAIVGSGFSGLGMAIRLQQAGRSDFVVLEKAGDLGGTWRDNTYPGAACDVPSHLYSFSFAPNPAWSRSFSPQPEIWAYLRKCAAEAGVLDRFYFDHDVLSARWDAGKRRWQIETSQGSLTARVLISGTGPLSEPSIPEIPGLAEFSGPVFHSARWDHSVDLAGKTVAVIGTGASAIQFVPEIQPVASKVEIFQRTAPWIVPRRDRNLSRLEGRLYKRFPLLQALVRAADYWVRELYLFGFLKPREVSAASKLALRHLEKQVRDPQLRARLTPNYIIGCKRILISNDWYRALCKPNVELLTSGLREVRGDVLVATDGEERGADVIIFGTGFHATDMPFGSKVFGEDGRSLADAWSNGMEAYLGTSVAGFPNFFMLIGPNTGLGHNSMIFMIESQLAYVIDALETMDARGEDVVSVRRDVQSTYNEDLQKRLVPTVWNSGGCRSWYLDSQGRNTSIWPGFTWEFRKRTRKFDRASYESVALEPRVTEPTVTARR